MASRSRVRRFSFSFVVSVVVAVAAFVAAGAFAAPAETAGFVVTGRPDGAYAALDGAMRDFMVRNAIPAGQLAVGRGGSVAFSRAYTNPAAAEVPVTLPTTVFRVSSISKAFELAALDRLFADGAVAPSTPVYAYLGIGSPLLRGQRPDPRAGAITVQEVVDHTAGFHDDNADAPEFQMRSIERAAHLDRPLTRDEFARYLYGRPLAFSPGSATLYSNEGYFLLTLVIEKATGSDYLSWVDANVLRPIGIDDDLMTATDVRARAPNEAVCVDPGIGPSVLEPERDAVLPVCYGGQLAYEVIGGSTSVSTSAASLVKFLGHHNAYGLGPRLAGSSRYGSFVGSYAWMEALPDGTDFAFAFDSRVDARGVRFDPVPLTEFLEKHL